MKKFLSVVLTALFLVSAAAHAGERYVKPGSFTVNHSAKEGAVRDIQLTAKEYEIVKKWKSRTESWTEYDEDFATPSSAKSKWHGYFDAYSEAQKVSALKLAISGLNSEVARLIVQDGGFSPRPISWNAFVAEVKALERNLEIKNLRYTLCSHEKNGRNNFQSLGYNPNDYINQGDDGEADFDAESRKAWFDYFAFTPRKATLLSKAVRGIGDSTAEMITEKGYFHKKPQTWEDFKSEIQSIDGREHTTLFENVVARYGSSNKQNLYGAKRDKPKQKELRTRQESGSVWSEVTEEYLVDEYQTRFDVTVEGSQLLTGEKELFTFNYDGKKVTLSESRTYNNYDILRDGNVYKLIATKRNAVRPDVSDFSVTLGTDGGKLMLRVSDNRQNELQALSPELSYVVTFTVMKKVKGMCSSDEKATTKSVSVSKLSDAIDVLEGAAGEKGAEYYLKALTVTRVNTVYFSGASGEKTTSPVKFQ